MTISKEIISIIFMVLFFLAGKKVGELTENIRFCAAMEHFGGEIVYKNERMTSDSEESKHYRDGVMFLDDYIHVVVGENRMWGEKDE